MYSVARDDAAASSPHTRSTYRRPTVSFTHPHFDGLVPRTATPRPSHASSAYKVSWHNKLLNGPEDLTPIQWNVAKGRVATIHLLKARNGALFVGKEITCEKNPMAINVFLTRECEATRLVYQRAGTVPDNIVSVYGVADVGSKKLLIMEKIDGPSGMSLLQTLRTLPVSDDEKFNLIKFTIRSLLVAAGDLMRAGIVHCDLTPPNFMYSKSGTVKVIDFGAWTLTGGPPASGTPGYEAPESRPHLVATTVAQPTPVRYGPVRYRGGGSYETRLMAPPCMDEKSDIFSIGMILYNLLGEIELKSDLGEALFNKMTKVDRADRFGIKDCLNHNFFINVSKDLALKTLEEMRRQVPTKN
ncbi:hypothetical protein GWC77_27265 [Paraburkholderia sp. NMBU_R16]|uniref:protein kinase family protein n=1 Tax=Paraburkholderia sp. NMBU_R16 TaxID=2698676 RepID=UPI001564795A|nr:protein kinase family protein [Paraburkholderia sp. NMBU_R16]NRO99565.1 hypothetical protein [Paraburkholderia sp. NMBU_R16]